MLVCLCRDNSIPSLDEVLNEDGGREQYQRMAELVAQQIELESTEKHLTPPHPHSPHPSLEPPHRSGDKEGGREGGREGVCVCAAFFVYVLVSWETSKHEGVSGKLNPSLEATMKAGREGPMKHKVWVL